MGKDYVPYYQEGCSKGGAQINFSAHFTDTSKFLVSEKN